MNYINPARKILWHTEHIQAIKDGRKPPPVNVEIDLSNRCSLGCEWCHFAYTHTRGPLAGKRDKPEGATAGGDLMSYDLAISIMRQLTRAGVLSITWTGGGEPTLHPYFDAIISACSLPQGLYTHGGHIDPERARLLKKMMSWVYISLDECTAVDYKASKGVNYFDRVVNNVTTMTKLAGQAVIGVGFMIHQDNYTKVAEMVRLGKQMGADYVQFRPTILYDQERPDQPAEYTAWIKQAIKWLRPYTDDPFVHVDIERFAMYDHWQRGYNTCYWTQLQTVITPNGKVWTCVNKREHAGAELGDLTQQLFSDIWQNSGACQVNSDCRVLCRGHLPNLTLNQMMDEPVHAAFI